MPFFNVLGGYDAEEFSWAHVEVGGFPTIFYFCKTLNNVVLRYSEVTYATSNRVHVQLGVSSVAT